jgi:hypothetical protein
MPPDATYEPAPPRSKFRLRFSLLALLIFVTLVCLGLAWLVQPTTVEAIALFQVSRDIPTILGDETKQSGQDGNYEIVKKSQLALLKSHYVLTAALRNPAVAALPILHGQTDSIAWLQERLEVEYPQNAEILTISLRGPEDGAQDLVRVVDAVAKAYRDEVIYEERQRRLGCRDLLARSLDKLNKEINRKLDEYIAIARELGGLEDSSNQVLQELDMKRLDRVEIELMRLEYEQLQAATGDSTENGTALEQRIGQLRERQAALEKNLTSRAERIAELTARKHELDRLQHIADEMSIKLEKLDIEANAPDRIRQIQPAVVVAAD